MYLNECKNVSQRIELNYSKFAIEDDCIESDITTIFEQCIQYIKSAHENNGVVFVHCLEGVSRSVCVVLCYMVKVLKYSFKDSCEIIRNARPQIDPFPIYVQQNLKYLND
jgi:protein-tyrosine phosphatase